MKGAIGITSALLAICLALTVATRDLWPTNDGLTIAIAALLGAIGVLLAAKLPGNAIGWLFIATAILASLDSAVRLYLVFDYRQHGGTLALGRAAIDYRGGVAILPFLVSLPSILLFPNGQVPSRRWRRALVVYIAFALVFSVLQFVGAGLASRGRVIPIDVRGNVPDVNPGAAAGVAWIVGVPYFLGFWLASVGHQARSWRRASGERRAQLKWLASGAFLCVVGTVTLVIFGDGSSIAARIAADLSIVAVASFPVAIGIGILRYRLYEIDRLVSRTISYTIVTGLLVGTFVGLVALITGVLPFSSPVGVAASTLVAAALFNPVRVRVQHVVDRRFNRARYDADATVDAFARRLRDAVDLDTVEAGLLDAVVRAVEPTHLSMWIRRPT
jgi:hypothetical protein